MEQVKSLVSPTRMQWQEHSIALESHVKDTWPEWKYEETSDKHTLRDSLQITGRSSLKGSRSWKSKNQGTVLDWRLEPWWIHAECDLNWTLLLRALSGQLARLKSSQRTDGRNIPISWFPWLCRRRSLFMGNNLKYLGGGRILHR